MIKKLIAKWLCCHEWESHHTTEVYEKGQGIPWKTKETLICKKCGKIKQIIL